MLRDQAQCLTPKRQKQLALNGKGATVESTLGLDQQGARRSRNKCGHAQFRPWWRLCLAGAGRDKGHLRVERPDAHAIPVLAADQHFMRVGGDDEANARYDVGKFEHSRAVPHIGTRHPKQGTAVYRNMLRDVGVLVILRNLLAVPSPATSRCEMCKRDMAQEASGAVALGRVEASR